MLKKSILIFLSIIIFQSQYLIARDFITIWNTNSLMAGGSKMDQINFPGQGNYIIEWTAINIPGIAGRQECQGNTLITFPQPGIYQINVSGGLSRLDWNQSRDNHKLKSIEQWGDIQWTSMDHAFANCRFLKINATDAPDLSKVKSMNSMFSMCEEMNAKIGHWDLSKVETIEGMFVNANAFNQDLSNWNTSKIKEMDYCFAEADAFNQDIGSWDITQVEEIEGMFSHSGLSSTNYDKIICAWAGQNLKQKLWFENEGIEYCNLSCRNQLEQKFGCVFKRDIQICFDEPGDLKLDGAVIGDDGAVYFFKNNQYFRYSERDKSSQLISIKKKWNTNSIANADCATRLYNHTKYYFFKGDQVYRYDFKNRKMDRDFPKSTVEFGSGIPSAPSAVANMNNRTFYFFKDGKVYTFSRSQRKVIDIQPIYHKFPGLPNGKTPDAAFFTFHSDQALWLIYDDQIYQIVDNKVKSGFPTNVATIFKDVK